MPTPPPTLDVVIRIHDPARLDELNRAVFSAALQDIPDVAIHIVCQRFTAAGLQAVRTSLAPIMALAPQAALHIHNRTEPLPHDARAALLNVGMAAASGRFLAFLDYDDLIYPEGWRLLAAELDATGAAIAFGAVLNASVSRAGLVPLVTAKQHVFKGDGLHQLLHSNFCPLHSFLLDRTRLPPGLSFDETLAALEDYDFLLRVVSQCPSSFRLKDKPVGEYLLKDDGSNINPMASATPRTGVAPDTPRTGVAPDTPRTGVASAPHSVAATSAWAATVTQIDARKAHLTLSPTVQAQLGIDEPGLTVARFLERHAAPRQG